MNICHWKKALYLLLAAAMLSGCSLSNTESTPDSSKTDNTSSSVQTSEPSEDGSNADNVQEEDKPEFELNELKVDFSQPSGIYTDSFDLELSAENISNGKIFYTTDGSDPRSSDTAVEYSGAVKVEDKNGSPNVVSAVDTTDISGNFNEMNYGERKFVCNISAPTDSDVDKCTVIRAAVRSADGTFSQTFSGAYYFGTAEDHISGLAESCKAAGKPLSVISITADYDDLFDYEKGIYVKGKIFDDAFADYLESGKNLENETARSLDANYKQRGRAWERKCHIDFMEWDTDGAETVLSQDAGMRIQGNYSRSDLQKGLRLYARKEYGEKNFNYAFFGDDSLDQNGETLDKYKSIVLRAGGNCAFTAKFNDTYWQNLSKELDCSTKASRPCVVYLNGEYWGLYVLEEDYSDDYFEDHYGVSKDDVIVYKGDAEAYASGYKLDEGKLPEGETDEGYYFKELTEFFSSHKDLTAQEDYDEFSQLVDVESAKDYFLSEVWINNKWDWPGKNWSMWKTATRSADNEYGDGKWRFIFYDMEFGGVSGESDSWTNTVREDNYKPQGLLDMDTKNPAVLTYAYLMTNENFRNEYNSELLAMSEGIYEKEHAQQVLDDFTAVYEPLMDQFFKRYPNAGTTDDAINGGYASVKCISDFINKRGGNIQSIVDWIDQQF